MLSKFWSSVKRQLKNQKPYHLVRAIRRNLAEIDSVDRRFISLKPEKPGRGHVLFSYINEPFFLKPGEPVSNSHTHFWESLQIAQTFLELGYGVDVIRYTNNEFVPQKEYSFFIDARFNMERLAPLLNKDCVKIMHIDTAHCLFHNAAESRRLLELQQRRGVALAPRRPMRFNLAIEQADCATILGNDFTISTYCYAKKPIYRIPISTTTLYPWPAEKDFGSCRKHFLWLSSGGMVHKGLDLVLETFARMPDYHVTICGPVGKEKDFETAYYKELYQTPNIHTIGWIDTSSSKFTEITQNCLGLIYPSCSEGQSGAVVTCLHAGLIPVISYESGVDVDDFGLILKTCSLDEIRNSIQTISNLGEPDLKQKTRQAWEFARARHTREKFSEEYRKIVANIITTYRR